ncbi:hypothetical protein THAOC_18565 [Thalassiosira oceanica]|uniref:MATH domain-containing protein n=1 Tax=Thalassiosira oceanica TaxID=159749 RepID=K0S6U4_THAOC|nr:hypothetical protein THAOC_18565 [Thalassiosira oceanica]|eukprot:EJK61010.1 hypothetical protein THAOC_18565 [Thalassiosira oceanica]
MAAAVKVAADVHVGPQPGPLSDWIMRKVHFHGFAGLLTTQGTEVKSPKFSCFGHKWIVSIYPGGHEDSNEGEVAVYLCNESPESIRAFYKIVLKHPTNQAKRYFKTGSVDEMETFTPEGSVKGSCGTTYFAKREKMLTYLNNGTLTLEIHLRTYKQAAESASFVPSNPCSGNLLKGFNNEEMSDVAFEVGGEVESAANRRKRAKSTATTFHACHAILRFNAPALADMCRPGGWGRGRGRADQADGDHGRQHAGQSVICQLEESCAVPGKIMDFVAEDGDKIDGNVSFSSVPSELISDILTAVARGKMPKGDSSGDDLKFMRVGELRRRLNAKGLCIDGSRETMIALLREDLASSSDAGAE